MMMQEVSGGQQGEITAAIFQYFPTDPAPCSSAQQGIWLSVDRRVWACGARTNLGYDALSGLPFLRTMQCLAEIGFSPVAATGADRYYQSFQQVHRFHSSTTPIFVSLCLLYL
jgi:hypothetical protein